MVYPGSIHNELSVTVSGSFKRHLRAIQEAVAEFQSRDVMVLSPSEPTIVDSFGDFVFVASDRRRSIKGVQNRHLSAIRNSDFLWLVSNDGYVGQSASMELGFAVAEGIPVYSDGAPTDLTLRQYCTVFQDIGHAIEFHYLDREARDNEENILIAPERALAVIGDELAGIESHLSDSKRIVGDPVEDSSSHIRRLLLLPAQK